MSKKYEFKGELLEEFKKALKALANSSTDEPATVVYGVACSFKHLYEEVEKGTEFGRDYISLHEDICNRPGSKLTPQDLFDRIYRMAESLDAAKGMGISPPGM